MLTSAVTIRNIGLEDFGQKWINCKSYNATFYKRKKNEHVNVFWITVSNIWKCNIQQSCRMGSYSHPFMTNIFFILPWSNWIFNLKWEVDVPINNINDAWHIHYLTKFKVRASCSKEMVNGINSDIIFSQNTHRLVFLSFSQIIQITVNMLQCGWTNNLSGNPSNFYIVLTVLKDLHQRLSNGTLITNISNNFLKNNLVADKLSRTPSTQK